jgi:hypothetical protein
MPSSVLRISDILDLHIERVRIAKLKGKVKETNPRIGAKSHELYSRGVRFSTVGVKGEDQERNRWLQASGQLSLNLRPMPVGDETAGFTPAEPSASTLRLKLTLRRDEPGGFIEAGEAVDRRKLSVRRDQPCGFNGRRTNF